MNDTFLAVCEAAELWFRSKRPLRFTEEDHLKDFQVNCISKAEVELACNVAIMVMERKSCDD